MDFKESTKGDSQYNLGIIRVLEVRQIIFYSWHLGNYIWIQPTNLFNLKKIKCIKPLDYQYTNSILVSIHDLWK